MFKCDKKMYQKESSVRGKTNSNYFARWLLLHVCCSILHNGKASHSIKEVECSNVLERTMRSEFYGAKAKTGVRTCPHVAHGLCGVRSVNVSISEKIGIFTRVTRQSGSLRLKAIERSREELSHSRL